MVDRTLPTLNATSAPADNSIFLIRRNGQTEDEKVTGADLKSYMNNAPAISGGTIDNTVIGGTTPAAGTFTTLSSDTVNTGQGAVECYAMDQAVRTTDSVTFSSLSLTTDLAVTEGGTGASTASGARTNLGLVIGTDVQAYDAGLNSIAGLTTAADTGVYTTASDTYATYGLTAGGRALGGAAGTANTFPYFSALNTVSLASVTAAGRALIDDASAADQRTTLGLVIGTDVQAYDAGLNSIAGLTTAADTMIYTTASDTYATTSLTSFARTLLDDSSASAARTTLGLGTIATQAANNVSITGGSITGITDLAVADGGTGSSTAGGARTNLGLGTIATQDSNNVSISGGSISGITDIAIADGGTGASTAGDARTNLDVYSKSEVDALTFAASGTSVYQTSATSISNGTYTTLGFNAELYDDDAWHDNSTNNSRITVDFTGRVHVSGVLAANTTANGDKRARILKNGTAVWEHRMPAGSGVITYHTLSADIAVSTNDYIEVQLYQTGGGTVNSLTGTTGCQVQVHRIE